MFCLFRLSNTLMNFGLVAPITVGIRVLGVEALIRATVG